MAIRFVIAAAILFGIGVAAPAAERPDSANPALDTNLTNRVIETCRSLPLAFIENRGQVEGDADFYVQGSDRLLYFNREGITFVLAGREDGPSWTVKLDFVDSASDAAPRGVEPRAERFHYFRGAPADWTTDVPAFGRLVYRDLWPGIDLIFSGTVDRLKYAFHVRPGGDPSRISLRYRGAETVTVTRSGTLRVETPAGAFEDGRPRAWQPDPSGTKCVAMAYAVDAGPDESAAVHYGFDLGEYDRDRLLILDPVLRIYCGFLGGSGRDEALAAAQDMLGNAHVAGWTLSAAASFPDKVGPASKAGGQADAFVAKVMKDGSGLYFCGFLGGDGADRALGIAVDAMGCSYVVGQTDSTAKTFPVEGGLDATSNGLTDGFVAKVSYDGAGIEYAGFLGGAGADAVTGVDLDVLGRAYLTGWTESDAATFPVEGGPGLVPAGQRDAFAARIAADGQRLDYCGYLGGADDDEGRACATDASFRLVVAGWTASDAQSFPVKTGPALSPGGGKDAFVARISSDGSSLDYCGYLGGTADEEALAVDTDAEGRATVAGWTASVESGPKGFPVKDGPDVTYNGGPADAFVTRLSSGRFESGLLRLPRRRRGGSGRGDRPGRHGPAAPGRVDRLRRDELPRPLRSGPDLPWRHRRLRRPHG